ncbi:hypothetical protein GCM10009665_57370 [Kitasatospora nipponensis]|uniref:HTH tetR-type domain-containing protein n=1 Tax=Kitasatospora nipponensis TaxID=258049 RepID=A0ABN1WQ04_9ACTN
MGRPPKRLVTREGIMRAALELVDDQGPGALSVTAVAARLGVKGPSIYTYVSGLDEVIEGIHELIVDEMDLTPGVQPWTAALDTWARSYRAAFAAHRRAVPLIAPRPIRAMSALKGYALAFAVLREAGWPEEHLLPVVRSVEYFLIGSALDLNVPAQSKLPDEDLPPGLDPLLNPPHNHNELAFETGLAALTCGLKDALDGIQLARNA